MRSYVSAALIFAVLLLTIPAIPLFVSEAVKKDNVKSTSTEPASSESMSERKSEKDEYIVLDITTGKTETISAYDYVTGAVCAEMPATFEKEALKAQAVAAHTYAERQKERALADPDPELCGAYFSNDSTKFQAYFTENQAKQYYGENYEQYMEKIHNAVDEVQNEIIVYEGEPIIAAFHSMSPGKTESAENVWGSDIDYLVPVESISDASAPKFLEEVTFTEAEMKEKLESSFDNINLSDDPEKWFSSAKTSVSGTVLSIEAGECELTGQQLRAALSLRSAAFDISFKEGVFTVATKGCGHAVGMSQFGANAMAESGSDYKEILEHYYPGTKISADF